MTPYQRLQPFFDAYNSKITDARSEHHMSLNDLSEAAGVSYSAIATQSAGTACNPKLFEQAAIADLFGLSLDELCGLREPQDVSELTERIHQLELENVRQAGDIRRLEELDAEKDKRFSSYRPMVYALVAGCVLLGCALIASMIVDARLSLYAVQCLAWDVLARAFDCHTAGFRRMLELMMTSDYVHFIPTVNDQSRDDFSC